MRKTTRFRLRREIRIPKPVARDEKGVALIVALLVMVLFAALGLSLTMVTSTERAVAAAFGDGAETFHAADAAFERAVAELTLASDWTQVLAGSIRSVHVDGVPGARVLPDGAMLDLMEATALLTCGKAACTSSDVESVAPERPWGANNPQWQLYAHAPAAAWIGADDDRGLYIVVWVADDPLENDGLPLVDGNADAGPNPGKGLLQLRVHAFGRAGARRMIEATVSRADSRVRVLSWREVRRS